MQSSSNMLVVALVALVFAGSNQPVAATSDLLGGIGGLAAPTVAGILGPVNNLVGGITQPVMGTLNSVTGGLLGPTGLQGVLSNTLGGFGTLTGGAGGLVGNTLRLTTGAVNGMTSGYVNGMGGMMQAVSPGSLANSMVGSSMASSQMIKNNFKRQAMSDSAMMAATAAAAAGSSNSDMYLGGVGGGALGQAAATAAAVNSGSDMLLGGTGGGVGQAAATAAGVVSGVAEAAVQDRGMLGAGMIGAASEALANNQALATGAALGQAAAVTGAATGAAIGQVAASAAGAAAAGASTTADHVNAGALIGPVATQMTLSGRQALTMDAVRNAQAESAAAGAEMVSNGAINARSASLASNAYRQAKLASARDRVNIAGTIQNSARMSDAAIATHDAATKAEDSLLGSELAVDSASTVLDSDAAYIPPVTNSLLRSLPYGRLGIRNIIPKPLTQPSVMLPDVWLNGVPVNYLNVPLKLWPYGLGPMAPVGSLAGAQLAMASGAIFNGQPLIANNGMILNSLVFDPAYAYMMNRNINGLISSSLAPILANGQLEAQDELAMANLLNMQQMNGAGMASTYQGYGRLNPVPMITGSVSDVNLMPTTTIGTTYPIGSALVIEPRDSYFQDYTDNASSRQNFDERQQ